MPRRTPTLLSSTDNGSMWHLAQKRCSELLKNEQTWNPEAGVLKAFGDWHDLDTREMGGPGE